MNIKEQLQFVLQERYPYKEQLGSSEFIFDQEESLKQIDGIPALNRFWPDKLFFRSRLTTGYDEFRKVDFILAVDKGNATQHAMLLSPLYDPKSDSFSNFLSGVEIDEADKPDLYRLIGTLFTSLYLDSGYKLLEGFESEKIMLLRNENPFLTIQVEFDKGNMLSRIKCIAPELQN